MRSLAVRYAAVLLVALASLGCGGDDDPKPKLELSPVAFEPFRQWLQLPSAARVTHTEEDSKAGLRSWSLSADLPPGFDISKVVYGQASAVGFVRQRDPCTLSSCGGHDVVEFRKDRLMLLAVVVSDKPDGTQALTLTLTETFP